MILSFARAIMLYLVLIGVIRLLGKRQIGEMEPSEFVVTMLIANLASIPMQDGAIPLLSGLIPILTVLGVELVLSWGTLRSLWLRKLLCGRPVILIDNGKILQSNLRKTRITMDELMAHLREKDVLDLKTVQFAILETDGELSVFPYGKPQFLPVTVIEDGVLLEDNLKKAGKDGAWVQAVLRERGASREMTLLLTVDAGENITWIGKERSE